MATTDKERRRPDVPEGIADGKGMLFDFSPEQQISMWMKNTYISLDMIFIRADAYPADRGKYRADVDQIISSGGLAKGVLEVIAGTAQNTASPPATGWRTLFNVVRGCPPPCWRPFKRVSSHFPT